MCLTVRVFEGVLECVLMCMVCINKNTVMHKDSYLCSTSVVMEHEPPSVTSAASAKHTHTHAHTLCQTIEAL